MDSIRVIIAGGRDFDDYELLKEKCDYYLKKCEDVTIISGCAHGADSLGKQYGVEHGYKVEEYPANWNAYGKRAGFVRNQQMANVANACIVFWDGQSKGTADMIKLSREKNLKLKVVRYDNGTA